MPAEDFLIMRSYFDDRPFLFEILENNFARLTAFVFNTSLRAKQRIRVDDLIPQYMKEKPIEFVPKTRDQQRQEFSQFKAKFKALKEQRNKKKRKPA